MSNLPSSESDPQEPPKWDREAARARYRKLMRSWPMRLSYLVLVLTILFAWAWGVAAAVAPSVERIPGHDITVPTENCVACHTVRAEVTGSPPINHPTPPSCGFCHRQSPPENGPQTGKQGGWLREPRS